MTEANEGSEGKVRCGHAEAVCVCVCHELAQLDALLPLSSTLALMRLAAALSSVVLFDVLVLQVKKGERYCDDRQYASERVSAVCHILYRLSVISTISCLPYLL